VDDLEGAIRSVLETHLFLCSDASKLVALQRYQRSGEAEDARAAADRLSGREREVLALLALGHSSKEIGHKLAVSPRTVNACRTRLRTRLGLARRPELVRFALRSGLLEVG